MEKSFTIEVIDLEGKRHQLNVSTGSNLREVLRQYDLSPYVSLTEKMNCGGRGLCATCGVWIEKDAPVPTHWHDKAADRFGYPRLSCQIKVNQDMRIRLAQKIIWGKRSRR